MSRVPGGDPRGELVYQAVCLVQVGEALGDAEVERHVRYPSLQSQIPSQRRLGGRIVRSKTSGVGRRVEVQAFYVSDKAWLLSETWLEVGYQIFEKFGVEARMEKRDFLMARPSKGLDGFRGSMVSYSDAMAMSRAILRELRAQLRSGGELEFLIVDDEVGSYWSEHSERVTMASWAGALKIPQEVIKRWGRWAPSVDEEYVKTTKKLVMEAQEQVADKIKMHGLREDILGEEEVMRGLEQRLRERGVREEKISLQMRRLRFQQKSHRFEMAGALDSGASEVRRDVEVPPTSPGDSVMEELDLEGLDAEAPDEMVEIGMGIYVMSLVGRSKRRTLHQVGSCYRRPGLDYKDYVVIGDQRPELKAGERLCGSCFGAKDKNEFSFEWGFHFEWGFPMDMVILATLAASSAYGCTLHHLEKCT